MNEKVLMNVWFNSIFVGVVVFLNAVVAFVVGAEGMSRIILFVALIPTGVSAVTGLLIIARAVFCNTDNQEVKS